MVRRVVMEGSDSPRIPYSLYLRIFHQSTDAERNIIRQYIDQTHLPSLGQFFCSPLFQFCGPPPISEPDNERSSDDDGLDNVRRIREAKALGRDKQASHLRPSQYVNVNP